MPVKDARGKATWCAPQVSTAALERLFLFDLWSQGVSYGHGRTTDPRAMAKVIGEFVIGRSSVHAVSQRFPWFEFEPAARAHEARQLVELRWPARRAKRWFTTGPRTRSPVRA